MEGSNSVEQGEEDPIIKFSSCSSDAHVSFWRIHITSIMSVVSYFALYLLGTSQDWGGVERKRVDTSVLSNAHICENNSGCFVGMDRQT